MPPTLLSARPSPSPVGASQAAVRLPADPAEAGRVRARWELRPVDEAAVARLQTALGISPLLATLLCHRGLTEPDDARHFLDPRLASMPDPFRMKGMREAVDRIARAMQGGERICVWGDYDVDGVTSASQLLLFFDAVGVDARYFVPDRFTDGYGLSEGPIRDLAAEGLDLLITVDCGVTSVHEVAVAKELGVDVVVVDHHKVPEVLPDAVALLDPLQPGCGWPERTLAACGVTWVLLVALRKHLRDAGFFGPDRAQPDLRDWLDLTAIGTVADLVPLQGLNRAITRHGLRRIALGQPQGRPGVQALCDIAGLDRERVTAGSLGFHLGPRINAAGRLAHASAGVELLTCEDHADAKSTAEAVDRYNRARRDIQERIFEEACALAEQHPDPARRRALVVAKEGWHPGVLGIVASKLVERYHRPTVVLGIDDGVASGSARSIRGFKLVDHLRAIDELLDRYGGHDHAAGLALAADKVDAFTDALDGRAADALDAEALQPVVRVDARHPLSALSFPLVADLKQLAPHGMGNPEPTLLAEGVRVIDSRLVGQDKRHLKLVLDAGAHPMDAIAFGQADDAPAVGSRVDVVYVPEVNVYRGRSRLQAKVKALRPAE